MKGNLAKSRVEGNRKGGRKEDKRMQNTRGLGE